MTCNHGQLRRPVDPSDILRPPNTVMLGLFLCAYRCFVPPCGRSMSHYSLSVSLCSYFVPYLMDFFEVPVSP